jgi:hypothetical protein
MTKMRMWRSPRRINNERGQWGLGFFAMVSLLETFGVSAMIAVSYVRSGTAGTYSVLCGVNGLCG